MTSGVAIALVAVAAGLACALAGVFLVLRRMAMMADAISHSILPGIVAGYVLARGPNIVVGFVGAATAGLLTVVLVEALTKSKRVRQDSAIGLVFPILFAIGVFVVSKYYSNVHIDTDAVLYGEIAFAPFDSFVWNGMDLGPTSLWVLGGLTVFNAAFLAVFYKELKLSTFDAGLAASLGFLPGLLHYALMAVVAFTTVGAFSAVGAILSVALIIVPAVTASLLVNRLAPMIALSLVIGAAGALIGYGLATLWDVSISGMIAVVLGGLFALALIFAPSQGLITGFLRRHRQRAQFAAEVLLVHLFNHADTPEGATESTLLHIERELDWGSDRAARIARWAVTRGLITVHDGVMSLTTKGRTIAEGVAGR